MSRSFKLSVFQEKPELEVEWHKDNSLDPLGLGSRSTKAALWLCRICGNSWQAQVGSRVLGKSNCPFCSYRTPKPGFNTLVETHPTLAKEWAESNDCTPSHYTKKSTQKILWSCRNNHSWYATIRSRALGAGCSECRDTPRLEQSIQALPESILKELSPINSSEQLQKTFIKSQVKLTWSCHLNHSWEAAVSSRLRGASCPICSNVELLTGYNDIMTKFPELASEIIDKELAASTLFNSGGKILWCCKKCGHSEESRAITRNKNGCRKCNRRNSVLETKVFDYLCELADNTSLIERRIRPLKSESGKLEIDIFIPSLKIGFEVQDFTTHSKDNDFERGHPWSESGFKHGPSYHENKRMLAKSQLDVIIYDLWEDEIRDDSFKASVNEKVKFLKLKRQM